MHQKLEFDNRFWISDYTNCFALVGGKSQEGKQLKFAPQLDKFA